MKNKKQKPVPFVTWQKLKMQFDAINSENNKNYSLLKSSQNESDMRGLQIINLGKSLKELQLKYEAIGRKFILEQEKLEKLQVDLDRERKMVDYLIKDKE